MTDSTRGPLVVRLTSLSGKVVDWFRSSTGRKIVEMVMTRGVVTVTGAGAAIWAARCLGATNLGLSAAVQGIVFQFVFLINLNQDTHLVREFKNCRSDEGQNKLICQALSFRGITAFFATILLLTVYALLVYFDRIPQEWKLPVFFGIVMFFVGSFSIQWIFHGQERQHIDIRSSFLVTLLTLVGYAVFMRPHAAPGLNLAVIASAQMVVMLLSWRFLIGKRYDLKVSFALFKQFWPILKRGRWLFLTGLFGIFYTYMAAPLLAALDSAKSAGHYRGAEQLVGAISPFFQMVAIILYPIFINLATGDFRVIWRLQIKLLWILGLMSLILVLSSFFIAPYIVEIVLGSEFSASVVPFSLLLCARCLNMLGGLFLWALYAKGHDRFLLFVSIITTSLCLALNLVLVPKFGAIAASFCLVVGECVTLLFTGMLCFRLKRR